MQVLVSQICALLNTYVMYPSILLSSFSKYGACVVVVVGGCDGSECFLKRKEGQSLESKFMQKQSQHYAAIGETILTAVLSK